MSEIGTGYIIQVGVENAKGINIRDLDFKCEFYVYTNRVATFRKAEMIHIQRKAGDQYFALLDSAIVGAGRLMCRITINDPVSQWAGGVRPVVIRRYTGKVIGDNCTGGSMYGFHGSNCRSEQEEMCYDEGFRVSFNFVYGLPKPDMGYIFYGNIVDQITDFGAITPDMLVNPENHIVQVEAGTMGKTSCGVMQPGNKVIVLIPEDTAFAATKDNGIGGKVPFSEAVLGSNGGKIVSIDGVRYRVYGEMLTVTGELFIYVN